MLSHEFIFVFHEKASGYTARTQVMNQALRQAGVTLDLYPLLRLKYATWDALAAASAGLLLPPHLASAFGQKEITGADFGRRWELVCEEQEGFLRTLRSCRSPREMMSLLAQREDGEWPARLREYEQARLTIRGLRERTSVLEVEVGSLRGEARELKARASALEREKGDDFRRTVQPLREQIFDLMEAAARRLTEQAQAPRLTKAEKQSEVARLEAETQQVEELRQAVRRRQQERAHYDEAINALRRSAHQCQTSSRGKSQERVKLERSEQAAVARQSLTQIEYQAELERLRLTRDAITVTRGLRYTNYRPAAWWLPLVSPDGAWFQELVRTAELRVEEL